MAKYAFLILLIACGNRKVFVASVSENATEAVDVIFADLASLGHPDLIVKHSGGLEIISDSSLVAQHEGDALGYYDPANNRIVIAFKDEPLAYKNGDGTFTLKQKGLEIVLAHELGHAMGLPHSSKGLMSEGIGSEDQLACIGRAAECLLEALGLPVK